MNHSRQRNGHLPGNLAVTGQGRTVLPPLKHGCIGLRPRFCLAAAAVLTSLVAPSVGAAGELRVLHEQQILELTPANPVRAVAIDADTLVLGAPDDAERGKGTGAVYVFERPPGGTWVQTARLHDQDGRECHGFGRTVDIEGNTLVTNNWSDAGCFPFYYGQIYYGVQAFERDAAGWTQTLNPSALGRDLRASQGLDLAFDGTSFVIPRENYGGAQGAWVMARVPDPAWSAPLVQLSSPGVPHRDDESPRQHVDIHNGLVALGSVYENGGAYAEATLYQRDSDGAWERLPDARVTSMREETQYVFPRVAVGPRRRVAVNEFVFERIGFSQHVESVSLRPACAPPHAEVDVEFDEQGALAVVRTRLGYGLGLWGSGATLHLYRRIRLGEWEPVAQLIPRDNSPANVNHPGDYHHSFAIDSGVVVSDARTYDADAPTHSYVFSSFDTCLGHRGNWIELTPQRWDITHKTGPAYSIITSDYSSQSGDRPGEYALIHHHSFGDFDLTLKARSDETLGPYSAADYVVIFGYRNDDNYYYMMFNRYAVNNELFKVVNGVRQRIARAPRGSFLDNAFHRVDISRRGEQIQIRFDGKEYLTARDATFGAGAIGIGSYNDAASFDDIKVSAR